MGCTNGDIDDDGGWRRKPKYTDEQIEVFKEKAELWDTIKKCEGVFVDKSEGTLKYRLYGQTRWYHLLESAVRAAVKAVGKE